MKSVFIVKMAENENVRCFFDISIGGEKRKYTKELKTIYNKNVMQTKRYGEFFAQQSIARKPCVPFYFMATPKDKKN